MNNGSCVSKTLERFIEYVFASIVFSCVASFVQASAANSIDLATPKGWFSVVDAISRALIAVLAALYFYIVFQTKIQPEFATSVRMWWCSLAFSVAAALCGGWYLFLRVEYFAVGAMLVTTAVCFRLARPAVENQVTSMFLSRGWRYSSLLGTAVLFAGCLTLWFPDLMAKLLKVGDVPVLHPVLRGLFAVLVIWGIHRQFRETQDGETSVTATERNEEPKKKRRS